MRGAGAAAPALVHPAACIAVAAVAATGAGASLTARAAGRRRHQRRLLELLRRRSGARHQRPLRHAVGRGDAPDGPGDRHAEPSVSVFVREFGTPEPAARARLFAARRRRSRASGPGAEVVRGAARPPGRGPVWAETSRLTGAVGDWCIGNTVVSKTAASGSTPGSPVVRMCASDRGFAGRGDAPLRAVSDGSARVARACRVSGAERSPIGRIARRERRSLHAARRRGRDRAHPPSGGEDVADLPGPHQRRARRRLLHGCLERPAHALGRGRRRLRSAQTQESGDGARVR